MINPQEKCKFCGKDLTSLEIFEICNCEESIKQVKRLSKISKIRKDSYTKLDCIGAENCKVSIESLHKL